MYTTNLIKFLSCICFCCIIGGQIHAQQAYEGTIEYDKKKQDAFVIDYPYPPEAVEGAILAKLEKMGYKPKEEKGLFNKDKGFKVYKSAFITEISDKSMDYLIKVEPKSRKNQDESVVYFIIQKDGNNAKSSFMVEDVEKAKAFLGNLRPGVEASNLELQIRNQESVLTKAEKKLKGLQDDQSDLEKKLKTNKENQEATQKDIEQQKKLLEELKGKRKG